MNKYRSTYVACFIGIINQSVIANITAILFVPFMQLYGLRILDLGLLIAINFAAQMVADVVLTFIVDKFSFRPPVIIAGLLSFVGLIMFGLTPIIFKGNILVGIILATLIFAFSGGMLEVLISPIIDNTPNVKGKGAAMSLMHSFYAWGQVAAILLTTLFLFVFGFDKWFIIVLIWAVLPLICTVMFVFAPLDKKVVAKGSAKKTFGLFFVIALIAIMTGGGTEIVMNQWISTFLNLSGLSKMTADLLGMGLFAVMMGVGRSLYGKFGDRINMSRVLMIGALGSFVCYLLAGLMPIAWVSMLFCAVCGFTASLLWPGTLVVASSKFPAAGAWLFAVLAISGDIGGSVTPLIMGLLSDKINMSAAFMIMSVIPLICFLCHLYLFKKSDHKKMLNGANLDANTAEIMDNNEI